MFESLEVVYVDESGVPGFGVSSSYVKCLCTLAHSGLSPSLIERTTYDG